MYDLAGKFVPDLLHLGSTERRSQDAPHSLPAFIPQHEQTVAHGLGEEAQTLCEEQADATHPLELNPRNSHEKHKLTILFGKLLKSLTMTCLSMSGSATTTTGLRPK